MLKKYIIALFYALFALNVYAQTSTAIPLIKKTGSSFNGWFTQRYAGNRNAFKGIPDFFTEKNSIIKTINFGGNSIIKDTVFLIIGDVNKEWTCIIDANNNKDFSDDFCYRFSDSSTADFPAKPISISFNYMGENIKKDVFITPNFNSKGFQFSDSIEQKYFITILLSEYKEGIYKSGNNNIRMIALRNHFYPLYDSGTVFLINKVDEKIPERVTAENSYELGAFYNINDSEKIRITHIDINGDSLCIEKSKNGNDEKIIGTKVGFHAPEIKAKDVNGKSFTLNDFQNNYTLIDFWGTWCQPCVAAIPHLKQLHTKYKSLRIISIACEESDLKKAKQFILENKMNWTNLYDFFKGKQELIKSFDVDTFPSVFLIDTKGKIIYRGNNNDNALDELLKKIYGR